MPLPERDEMFNTKGRMLQDIMVSLGGRIAEEIIFDDITTGASSDIKKATKEARSMVTRYGFSENIGVINYDDEITRYLSEEIWRIPEVILRLLPVRLM